MNKQKKDEILTKKYKIKNLTYGKILVFLSILFVLLVSLLFATDFEKFINGDYYIVTKNNIAVDENGLFVHYINVGQGDATFIEFPDGKNMLIDCGTYASDDLVDYINNTKCEGRIDYFILTHSHNDHYGQIENIFNSFDIGVIYRPNIYATDIEIIENGAIYYGVDNSDAYKSVVESIKNEARTGSEVVVTKPGLKIINEEYDYKINFLASYDNASDPNDFSPIILLNYKNYKYIFSGDASQSVENYVVNNFSSEIADCFAVKVGHHGSNTSSSQYYLDTLKAEYAVISVLEGTYKSVPSSEVYKRLAYSGVEQDKILRTDVHDTIISFTTEAGDCLLYSINDLKTPNNTVYIKWYYICIVVFTISVMIIFNKKIVVINLLK